MKNTTFLFLAVAGVTAVALAFDGHYVTEGPVTLLIDPIETITQYGKTTSVNVTLSNSGNDDLNVNVRLEQLVDEMAAVGQTQKAVRIPSGGRSCCTFSISCGEGACSAMYPVHIYADFKLNNINHEAHAVQIVQTRFTQKSQKTPQQYISVVTVPSQGALDLLAAQARVSWMYFDGPEHKMPVGWTGTDEPSGTYVGNQNVLRGELKPALLIHPPWKPRAGTAFIEYRLKLPDTQPLMLHFANAIRDHSDQEPASDGVTFRVWVNENKLYEIHTDAKVWQEGRVDLSHYAGREIQLRLESHPGPNHDTTCDASYWAQPMIIAGQLPVLNSPEQWETQRKRAEQLMTGDAPAPSDTLLFSLAEGYKAAVVLGPNGLPDASVAIGKDDKSVVFNGFDLSLLKQPVGRSVSGVRVEHFDVEPITDHAVRIIHWLLINGRKASLTAILRPDKAGLRISFDSSERITDLSLGQADQRAPRVYYGHGYCIENPKPFQAGFGGHDLSTSHVGFDFASGISLVTACDNPPDRLVVNPESHIYALHTHMNATLTLVPSIHGAFDAALRYRPLYDKQAAAAFQRKAGRFVFDIWGGRYADNARILQRMIDYGLTDSMLTLHVWQRWGYDYRLPDVYPPDPGLGTVEDLQALSVLCRSYDIPWGLHDNYIDFYPDAADYSYERIAFTETGLPIKAWLMESRDAQSYRWRPDCILPFVRRNLELIQPNLQPTHYFIDVFTSIGLFDFYDRKGGFHSSLETRKCWGEAFAWIRDALGGSAPTTSEAGDDQLIGYLDGADCQFLTLSSAPKGSFMIRLVCDDWERVPWYDAVLHDKFSLHGVGYSGRYQGGRDRETHGIESDDYLSAEMLTGHAMMIDREGFGRGAVRKYYLGQDFIRSIATDTVRDVQFVDGDIHRQKIRWNGGAWVCVNRSSEDWQIAGKILPPYGYAAQNGRITSSIEKIGDVTVEQSGGEKHFFVNARGYGDDNQLEITPKAHRVDLAADNQFKLYIDWQVKPPGPRDAKVFVHFVGGESADAGKITFQGDFTPVVPISNWTGHVMTGEGQIVTVPDRVQAGEYDILAGLWNPQTHQRYRLRGNNDGTNRCLLGKLLIQKEGHSVTDIKLIPYESSEQSPGWGNVARIPIDFGKARTSGAFRCEIGDHQLKIIPLPNLPAFDVELNVERIVGGKVSPSELYVVTEKGHHEKKAEYGYNEGWLRFKTQQGDFAYVFAYHE